MAEALAVNGARKVYLLGRRADVIKQAAAKYPDIMVPIVCDVISKESLQSAVDQITAETGYINLLVANSGIGGPRNNYDSSLSVSDLRAKLLSPSMEDFTQTFHVNVTGAWFTMASFLELLDAGNKHAVSGAAGAFGAPVEGAKNPSIQSQVVFTASLAAFSRAWYTAPAYGGSKVAILHLMKQAATNLAPYGIRANALAPGREYPPFPLARACGFTGLRGETDEWKCSLSVRDDDDVAGRPQSGSGDTRQPYLDPDAEIRRPAGNGWGDSVSGQSRRFVHQRKCHPERWRPCSNYPVDLLRLVRRICCWQFWRRSGGISDR